MNTLIIQSDKKKNKLITNLVKELGGKTFSISDEIMEDLILGNMMNDSKTNILVSKEEVLKKLRNV